MTGRLSLCHAIAFLKFQKNGMVQHLLHQLKYNHHPEIGVLLGRLYGLDLQRAGLGGEFDLIVPVPLHKHRQNRRGYNQSSCFAEGLSDALMIPWNEKISVRVTQTQTQTRKSKAERWENVKDVFATSPLMPLHEKRILLVDDVITTGATLEACGLQLINRGCKNLSIACIAEAQ